MKKDLIIILSAFCCGITGFGLSSPWYLLALLPVAALSGVGAVTIGKNFQP